MKVNEIVIANRFLSDLKLSKFDKIVRIAVLKNYMAFSKIAKDYENMLEDLRKKMFDDKQEEAQKVQEIRERLQKSKTQEEFLACTEELKQYKDFLDLEDEFIKLLNEESSKEVENIELTKIDRTKFVESLAASGIEFTPRDIDKVEIIFK